jgi:hypothetical protein
MTTEIAKQFCGYAEGNLGANIAGISDRNN